jgi:hypothetical protein
MQPINYLAQMPQVNLADSVRSGLAPVADFQRIQANRMQMEAIQQQQAAAQAEAQAAAERDAQFQALGARLRETGDPRIAAEMALLMPQHREAIKQAQEGLTAEQRRAESRFGMQVLAAMRSGNMDVAANRLDERIAAMEASGQDAEALKDLRAMLDENPQEAMAQSAYYLASTMDPKEFIENIGKIGEEGRAAAVAPAQRRKAEADATTAEATAAVAPDQARAGLELTRAQGAAARATAETAAEQLKRLRESPPAGQELTVAQRAVDTAFAKEYADFVASGGIADTQKNLTQLRDVQKRLAGGRENLTGPLIGSMPDALLAAVNPEAMAVRDRVQEVVQRNLRIVLGAQFTQKEGDALIARSYNPRLSEKENASRLEALIGAIDGAAKAKISAARYYEANGTLQGFRGELPTVADLDNAMERAAPSPQPPRSVRGLPPARRVTSQDEYNRLPSGARFTAPDGSVRIKP